MRILHIIPDLQKGGAQRLCLDICNELLKRENVEVLLVTLYGRNEYIDLSRGINKIICNSKVVLSLTGNTIVDLKDLESIVLNFKPDIIHSHLFEVEMISRYNTNPHIEYITHCHDNMQQFQNLSFKTFFNKKLVTNFYEKYILVNKYMLCNNYFITISQDNYHYFNSVLPKRLTNNINLLPNAIDYVKFYNPAPILLNEKIVISTVGSLVDKKNQLFLIPVVKYLANKGINVHLNIVGEGINRLIIEQEIAKEHLQKYITLHGNVDNVRGILKASTIYVHPASYEPFGLAILEAMAVGLPLVSLDGKGNRDIIKNGENGFIIKEKNPITFATKIMDIINKPSLFYKLSENARGFAKQFDIKNYVDKLLEIYKSSLKPQ
jgi:glycosyltransferase involved in cell wall biosynthesis